jgi:hypothetical protein
MIPIHHGLHITPNYRFVCLQFAEITNLAEVHQQHNGIYKALRAEDQNPELQKSLKAMRTQKVRWSGRVPMKLAKRQFGI